jgi:hypothetical protein
MRESREQWRERVAQWRASGLTASEFASRNKLKVHTLRHWGWKLGRETGDVTSLARVPALIEVHARAATDDRFEIELGGRRVRVPPSFDADALRRLLAALEGAP